MTKKEYEQQLREAAQEMEDNEDILEYLDTAKSDLESAARNVDNAEAAYEQVVIPGMPLIKFAEGNNYLKVARTNMLSAHRNLNSAFHQISVRGS